MEDIEKKVKEVILRAFDAQIDPEDIDVEVPLMEDGIGLDSVSILEIITGIEEEFELTVEDEEISDELFESISSLIDYVRRKLIETEEAKAEVG